MRGDTIRAARTTKIKIPGFSPGILKFYMYSISVIALRVKASEVLNLLRHAWFHHGYQAINSSEQFETAIGYPIRDHGISQVYLMDKTLVYEIIKIFLYLAITHVSGVHYFCFSRAFFPYPEHIGDYFYIRTPPTYTALPGSADFITRCGMGI
jgi:hypothetical protein